jgi:hypothetical protein
LIRFKAPVLPFLVLVLTAHYRPEREEKEAREMEMERRGWKVQWKVQYMFNSSIRSKECSRVQWFHRKFNICSRVQYVQRNVKEFKSSIPLHFDMLNATPYSLSIEGNLILERMNRFKYSMPRK